MRFSEIAMISVDIADYEDRGFSAEVRSTGDGLYDYRLLDRDCRDELMLLIGLRLNGLFKVFERSGEVPCPVDEFDDWATERLRVGHIDRSRAYALTGGEWVEISTWEQADLARLVIVDGACADPVDVDWLAVRL